MMISVLSQTKSESVLSEQMDLCFTVRGIQRHYVEKFFALERISDLAEVIEPVRIRYQRYVQNDTALTESQKSNYMHLLDSFMMYYLLPKFPKIEDEVINNAAYERSIRNTIGVFLMEYGIEESSDITYETREAFSSWRGKTAVSKKVDEYAKTFDRIKLESIRRQNEKEPFVHPKLEFQQVLYLAYHPDYVKAMSFWYAQDKEILLYDFSSAASAVICDQFVAFLNMVIMEKVDIKVRHDMYLAPIHRFFRFCMENGIRDIELLEYSEYCAYRDEIKGSVKSKETEYVQIVNLMQRFLFCRNSRFRFEAHNWYLDGFAIDPERTNEANPVSRISFWEITDIGNRDIFKTYIFYLLGLTDLALGSIRGRYYRLLKFCRYCYQNGIRLSNIGKEILDAYAFDLGVSGIKAATFNRSIIDIFELWNYMVSKRIARKPTVTLSVYLKNEGMEHLDLSVSEETIMRVVRAIEKAPEKIRCMYLLLLSTGCRICEVCAVKTDAFFMDEETAYMRIYQPKMRREKTIPIPMEIYKYVREYMERNKMIGQEYLFPNHTGKAYGAGYFSRQMKKLLAEAGIDPSEYEFRPHGYRHTVATRFHDAGVPLQVIREYMDHNSVEMTKQYIDFNGRRVEDASVEYLQKHKDMWEGQDGN